MPSPKQTPSTKLLEVQTAGFSLASALLLLLALCLGILQVIGLMDGINPNKELAIQFVPGTLSLGIIAWTILRTRRRGTLSVFTDRIEGQRPNGLPIQIPLDSINHVELKANAVALKNAVGELLLVQRLPNKTDGGLIWLLNAYRSWDSDIWQGFANADVQALPHAARHFLAEDGQPSFGDVGFIIQIPHQTWFFPNSPTVDLKGLGAGQLRMNQRAVGQQETQIQFQPQPDWLPLSRLCLSLLQSGISSDQRHEYLTELAENHGGCELKAQSEEGGFAGECLGYPVSVFETDGPD
jgi:hypothetical protein